MSNEVKELIKELNSLQSDYYDEYEGAIYYRNKYHEQQSKYERIGEKIKEKLSELRKIDTDNEFELDIDLF